MLMSFSSSYRCCPSFYGSIRQHSSTSSFSSSKPMDVSPKAWKQALVPYCNKLYQLLPQQEQRNFRWLYGDPTNINIEKVAHFSKDLLFFAAGHSMERQNAANNDLWGVIAPIDLEKFAGADAVNFPTILEFRIKTLKATMQQCLPEAISLLQLGEIATEDFFSLISSLNKEGLQFQSVIAVENSVGAMFHAEAYNRHCAKIPNLTLCADHPVTFLENNKNTLKEKKMAIILTESALRIRYDENPDKNLERIFGLLSKIIQKDMPLIGEFLSSPEE